MTQNPYIKTHYSHNTAAHYSHTHRRPKTQPTTATTMTPSLAQNPNPTDQSMTQNPHIETHPKYHTHDPIKRSKSRRQGLWRSAVRAMEVDGEVRWGGERSWAKIREILSREDWEGRDKEWRREKRKSDERGERKMNKKTINKNDIFIHTLSKMKAYCSMFYNFSTFSIPNEGLFLCLVCQMCQIFGIWHIWETWWECSYFIRICEVWKVKDLTSPQRQCPQSRSQRWCPRLWWTLWSHLNVDAHVDSNRRWWWQCPERSAMTMQNATSERSAMTIGNNGSRSTIYKREGIGEREHKIINWRERREKRE